MRYLDTIAVDIRILTQIAYMNVYICIRVCVHMCMFVYLCIHTHKHTHTHTHLSGENVDALGDIESH